MNELTTFQKTCLARLRQKLNSVGWEIEQPELGGMSETYLHTRVGKTEHPLELWIYEDEAMFMKEGGVDERFEIPDYRSSEDLIEHFTDRVMKQIGHPQVT